MRWMVFFTVLVVGCAATMPDDATITGDIAWGVAGAITAPQHSAIESCVRCGGAGVVSIGRDEDRPTCASDTVPTDAVLIVVEVPSDAVVEINGQKTESTGSTRQYMSRNLIAGKWYEFVVRCGSEMRLVTVRPGERADLSFVDAIETCPRCGGCGREARSVMVQR